MADKLCAFVVPPGRRVEVHPPASGVPRGPVNRGGAHRSASFRGRSRNMVWIRDRSADPRAPAWNSTIAQRGRMLAQSSRGRSMLSPATFPNLLPSTPRRDRGGDVSMRSNRNGDVSMPSNRPDTPTPARTNVPKPSALTIDADINAHTQQDGDGDTVMDTPSAQPAQVGPRPSQPTPRPALSRDGSRLGNKDGPAWRPVILAIREAVGSNVRRPPPSRDGRRAV